MHFRIELGNPFILFWATTCVLRPRTLQNTLIVDDDIRISYVAYEHDRVVLRGLFVWAVPEQARLATAGDSIGSHKRAL